MFRFPCEAGTPEPEAAGKFGKPGWRDGPRAGTVDGSGNNPLRLPFLIQ
jgi:hypothetical protein